MGCNFSKNNDCNRYCEMTSELTSYNCNDTEIDLTHFSVSEEILGVGGFGMVRSAKKLSGADKGSDFAIKSMNKSAILKRTSGTTFVCNLQYAFQDSSYLYMILEKADGGDMRFNLRATPLLRFSEEVAKDYCCQILMALDHCHKASILHRDIKPENILMTATGHLKLTDFGVSKVLRNIDECRSTSGTHGYMAPEIYRGQHIHGTCAEWFAVGVTLHEFLTGRRPFEVCKLQSYKGHSKLTDPLLLEFLDLCDYLTYDCKHFLKRLLHPQCSLRLGAFGGLKEIMCHPWLADIDWSALQEWRRPAPMVPDLQCPRTDINGEDLKKMVQQCLLAETLSEREQLLFRDYEFRVRVPSDGATSACATCAADQSCRIVSAYRHTEQDSSEERSRKRSKTGEKHRVTVDDELEESNCLGLVQRLSGTSSLRRIDLNQVDPEDEASNKVDL